MSNIIQVDYSKAIIPRGNFTWGEFLWMPRAARHATLTASEYNNAVFLFSELQKLRKELGRPLIITSGKRDLQYTRLLRRQGIPAAWKSAHIDGQAVDLTCPTMSTAQLWHWIDKRWPGRMELLAWTPSWVHLDTRDWGKRIRFKP